MTELILTKIGQAKYINDMYENEYLYFTNLKEFRSKTTDKSGRLDPKELNVNNVQINNLTIKAENKEIELHKMFKDFKGQFTENINDPKIHCCSLHWMELEHDKENSSFNKKLLEMGDKALLITNWEVFFKTLDESIESYNYKYTRKQVTYYNPKKFNGKLTLHHKDGKFEYQNEYRILISPTQNDPIKIPLSGLKKISTVIESRDINKLVIQRYN